MPLTFSTHAFARTVLAAPHRHTCLTLAALINGNEVFGAVDALDVADWLYRQYPPFDAVTVATAGGRVTFFELHRGRPARRRRMAEHLLAQPDQVITIEPCLNT